MQECQQSREPGTRLIALLAMLVIAFGVSRKRQVLPDVRCRDLSLAVVSAPFGAESTVVEPHRYQAYGSNGTLLPHASQPQYVESSLNLRVRSLVSV